VTIARTPMVDRFWAKIDAWTTDGCWNWTASLNDSGYGVLHKPGKRGGVVRAHRFAYELLIGLIPETLVIDHLCRNRACVNPDHMEPVTIGENVRRSPIATSTINALKAECSQGHAFDAANTYVNPSGSRRCVKCRDVSRHPRTEAQKAARHNARRALTAVAA